MVLTDMRVAVRTPSSRRRISGGRWLLLLASSLMLMLAGPLQAAERYVEGQHYKRVPIPVETQSEGKPEVVEVFSYMCIHCYQFDPTLNSWVASQGENLAFRRIPAVFNRTWALIAQAYFTAEALGVSEQMHGPLFRAIHQERLNLGDPDIMADLFRREAGVERDRFNQVFTSFGVRSKVQWADGQGRAYRVSGVPSLVVNGKYLVDGTMAGSNSEMLSVVEFLLEKERAEKAAPAEATAAPATAD